MSTAVVGGGVIGLSCAYEIAELGEDVQVVDAAMAGASASAGNAGWITPFLSMPRAAPGALGDAVRGLMTRDSPLRMRPHIDPGFISWSLRFLRAGTANRYQLALAALQALASRAYETFDSLESRGVAFEMARSGLGVVFQRPENLDGYQQVVNRTRGLGYPGEISVYRGSDVQAFDPAISSSVDGVIHLETERHVRPETLSRGLAEALAVHGSTVRENDAVLSVESAGAGRWRLRFASGDVAHVDRVVFAAGYATKRLLRPFGVNVPMEAAKGVSITAHGDGEAPKHALKLFEDMVACSPFGESVRLSGTFDVGARDFVINRKRLELVLRQGLSYFETWRPTETEMEWAGHRPTSSDDLPIIGPVPGHEGLYVATGHGTLGVTLGPVTGALAAREVVTGAEQDLLKPFRLTRF